MEINWKKIDPKKLPNKEVIAANFEKGTHGFKEKLIGYLSKDHGQVICESENEILQNCTHYCELDRDDNFILNEKILTAVVVIVLTTSALAAYLCSLI